MSFSNFLKGFMYVKTIPRERIDKEVVDYFLSQSFSPDGYGLGRMLGLRIRHGNHY